MRRFILNQATGSRARRLLAAALLAGAGFVGGALVVQAADEVTRFDASDLPVPLEQPAAEPLAGEPRPGT